MASLPLRPKRPSANISSEDEPMEDFRRSSLEPAADDMTDEAKPTASTPAPSAPIPYPVHALPLHKHLRKGMGPRQFRTWTRAMMLLFRAHGVFDIMRDAIDKEAWVARRERVWKNSLNPKDLLIGGSKTLTSTHLDVSNSSEDMTLLIRADLLIDSSIDEQMAEWVVGIHDPHTKWRSLREMCAIEEEEPQKTRNQRHSDTEAGDFSTMRELVDRMMKLRSEMITASSDISWKWETDHDFKNDLVERALTVMPEMEDALRNRLALTKRRPTYWEDPETKLTLCGFAAKLSVEAQLLWDVKRGLRAPRPPGPPPRRRGVYYPRYSTDCVSPEEVSEWWRHEDVEAKSVIGCWK